MKRVILLACLFFSSIASAKAPDCYSWPMNIAKGWLKNERIVAIVDLDESKTQRKRLASEKKAGGVYTQVYHFTFYDKHGTAYDVITQSDGSYQECSLSEVNVFLVSRSHLND
mgnify:CR=1 FL=1